MDPCHPNEKLPFDVLGLIFAYYAREETVKYPLETLLLVCRAWNISALGHMTLWSNFRIYLWQAPTSRMWDARLPLRLARCGPDIPLDIDIRNLVNIHDTEGITRPETEDLRFPSFCYSHNGLRFDLSSNECTCLTAATECIRKSLKLLGGVNGEGCARWRSVILYLGHPYDGATVVLRQPTPILEELELGRVRYGGDFTGLCLFPDVSRLKRLILFECHLPLPDCKGLLEIELYWNYPFADYGELSKLRNASRLRSFKLRSIFGAKVILPAQLNNLRVLSIDRGNTRPQDGLFLHQMPMVTDLSINIADGELVVLILQGQLLSMEKLTRLNILWSFTWGPNKDRCLRLLGSVYALLTRAKNLEYLERENHCQVFILRVLWRSRRYKSDKDPVFQTGSLINTEVGETVIFKGNESNSFVDGLAKRWCCTPPSLSDEDLITAVIKESRSPS